MRDTFPQYPARDAAGVMILTNMLPNQGNGTYRVYAFADDVEANQTLLGIRTFTSSNATAETPFGTIDTPAQRQTVSGVYTFFGWALTPQPGTILADAINILIDGNPVGHATYGALRSDIAALFPGLTDTNRASFQFTFDTRLLKNGVHSVEAFVYDSRFASRGPQSPFDLGRNALGSRYFIVNNP